MADVGDFSRHIEMPEISARLACREEDVEYIGWEVDVISNLHIGVEVESIPKSPDAHSSLNHLKEHHLPYILWEAASVISTPRIGKNVPARRRLWAQHM